MARILSLAEQPATFLARSPRLRKAAFPLLFFFAFLLFLLLTFPFDTLARRLELEAQKAGMELTIGGMGSSGLFGVRARDVKLRLPAAPGADPLPEIALEKVTVSPDLFALLLKRTSFSFTAEGYGGKARGHAALSNDPAQQGLRSLKLDASDLDLAKLPLKEATHVDLAGSLSLKADLPALQPTEASTGALSLTLKGAQVKSGSVGGFPLPPLAVGELDAQVSVDKGIAKIEHGSVRGGDLDADLDGSLKLRPLLSLSNSDLHVKFRLADKWLDANPTIKGAMGFIQNARQPDGSYVFSFSGPLSNLSPRPGR